ncbi:MAG TPA: solute carrier family 23 protein [Azospirillum sp.]|nr:solute carrier family 23 protein [Azospirillum sp.]
MQDRPQNLLYALDERPPTRPLTVLAVQHMVLALMFMLYPVIAAAEIGLSVDDTYHFVTTAVLAAGTATLLQASRLGSGFLAVSIPNPIVMPAFLAAARSGGLGMACGTLAACGIMQMGLARLLPRLRSFFPPEVCGVAVMMLGVSMVKGGVTRFTGYEHAGMDVDPGALAVGFATLGSIVLLSVWGKGQTRLYAMLIGCVAGYAVAAALGRLPVDLGERLAGAPLLAMPVPQIPALSIGIEALLPIFIGILLSMMDVVGCVITLDKMNKAHWARTEMPVVSRGVFADGLATTLGALGGGMGNGLSSANIGLAFASGATSRIIGFAAGALIIAAAFFPKLTTLLILMPPPVMGAVLVFTAACLITAGMELIMSRMLNERRMLVIGVSTILGISVTAVPGLYHDVPDWLEPLFHSELTVAAVAALLLNVVFRIGVGRRAELAFTPGTTSLGAIYDFLEKQGSTWGARRDVVQRATFGTIETMEALARAGLARGPVMVEASFDELNLDIRLRYAGRPLPVGKAEAVDMTALMDTDDDTAIEVAMRSVSFNLIVKAADRVSSSVRGEEALLLLHFDH